MGVKSDRWIREMCKHHEMIKPFHEAQVSKGVISYGVSSYGYDITLSDEFKLFDPTKATFVDPKHLDPACFVDFRGDICTIAAHSFVLGRTMEYFKIPREVLTLCVGKSSYARCGVLINVTPFEPEWEGYATLQIVNTTPLPAKIYAFEGIGQVIFFEADEVCEVSYKDKKGRYQAQKTITLPKIQS